jgi:multicomponent Na+:H+ antiporter subunit B
VAAAAFILYGLAYDVRSAWRAFRFPPQALIAFGLLVAVGSALVSLLAGRPFMTGLWTHIEVPELLNLDLGTPLFFDIGVYLVVLGIAVWIVLSLAEE